MRLLALISICLLSQAGCTEVLRKPNLSLGEVENTSAEPHYVVVGLEATHSSVAEANTDSFKRLVVLGGNGSRGNSKVVEERLIFDHEPPVNQRVHYTIGVGDVLLVSRPGYQNNKEGIATRYTSTSEHIVNESGQIAFSEGIRVFVVGKTLVEARESIQNALLDNLGEASDEFLERQFPAQVPPEYLLGIGDVIRVSRLIENANSDGEFEQSVQTNDATVGPDGSVNLLQIGEIEVSDLSLSQVRERVSQTALRSAAAVDTLVEMKSFDSKYSVLTGVTGTKIIPITDSPLSFERLVANLNLALSGDKDFRVSLRRDSELYQMSAKDIVKGEARNAFVFEGDQIHITEALPKQSVNLRMKKFGSKAITYLRVANDINVGTQQGRVVNFDLGGLDVRELLISQGVDVNRNTDLLVRIQREKETYKLSAKAAVLNNANHRYWLAPGDHVTVEDIPYVENNVLLVGEVGSPQMFPINQYSRTKLSEALFDGGAFTSPDADLSHVYVLRGHETRYKAYHFDLTNVLNLSLTDKFELRPGDIVFVRTRPLTRYTRALALALNFANAIDVGITNSRSFGR